MNNTNIQYTLDCLRGPNLIIGSGARAAQGYLTKKDKINWAKVKRVIEGAIKAAEAGNVMSLNILIQPQSVRRVNPEKDES